MLINATSFTSNGDALIKSFIPHLFAEPYYKQKISLF